MVTSKQLVETEGKYWIKTFQEKSYYKDYLEFYIYDIIPTAGVIYVNKIKSAETLAAIMFSVGEGEEDRLFIKVINKNSDFHGKTAFIQKENAVEEFDNFFTKVITEN